MLIIRFRGARYLDEETQASIRGVSDLSVLFSFLVSYFLYSLPVVSAGKVKSVQCVQCSTILSIGVHIRYIGKM